MRKHPRLQACRRGTDWKTFPQDSPSAGFLKEHGIQRICCPKIWRMCSCVGRKRESPFMRAARQLPCHIVKHFFFANGRRYCAISSAVKVRRIAPGRIFSMKKFSSRTISGDLSVLPTVALNFENSVAKVLPITISSAAMVKEKGRLIGIGIFELDEHFSALDNPAALCALLYFRHCFLTYRGLEQALAMLMGDTQASRDRRILVLR